MSADDGAEVFLNETLIGLAEWNNDPETLWVEDQNLFRPGTNVLRFYLVNHPVDGGQFGEDAIFGRCCMRGFAWFGAGDE